MKIGVITIYGSRDNYGQLLQAFALQTFLKNRGHNAFLIRYDSMNRRIPLKERNWIRLFHPLKLLNALKIMLKKKRIQSSCRKHPRHFEDFIRNHMQVSSREYLTRDALLNDPPDADAYITGSDIVWSYSKPDPAFFLQFGRKTALRLAYAPGFGFKFKVDSRNLAIITNYLKDFAFVSVREKQGVDICRKAGREDVTLVPDPVFLISAEEYGKIFSLPAATKPICLIYLVGNPCTVPWDEIEQYAREKKLDLKFIASQGITTKKSYMIWPTVEEFMRMIASAELVITNSFHGCALAILFHRQFVVLPLRHEDDRVNTLLNVFNLNDRKYQGDFMKHLERPIQDDKIEEHIQNDMERVNAIFDALGL